MTLNVKKRLNSHFARLKSFSCFEHEEKNARNSEYVDSIFSKTGKGYIKNGYCNDYSLFLNIKNEKNNIGCRIGRLNEYIRFDVDYVGRTIEDSVITVSIGQAKIVGKSGWDIISYRRSSVFSIGKVCLSYEDFKSKVNAFIKAIKLGKKNIIKDCVSSFFKSVESVEITDQKILSKRENLSLDVEELNLEEETFKMKMDARNYDLDIIYGMSNVETKINDLILEKERIEKKLRLLNIVKNEKISAIEEDEELIEIRKNKSNISQKLIESKSALELFDYKVSLGFNVLD